MEDNTNHEEFALKELNNNNNNNNNNNDDTNTNKLENKNSMQCLYLEIEKLKNLNENLKTRLNNYENKIDTKTDYAMLLNPDNANLSDIQLELNRLNRIIIALKNENEEKNNLMFKLEQDKKLLLEINKNYHIPTQMSGSNSLLKEGKASNSLELSTATNALKYYIMSLLLKKEFVYKDNNAIIIQEIFGKDLDYIKFLDTRIECLEHQNYFLLTKAEKFVRK